MENNPTSIETNTQSQPFRFISLQSYADTEWLADNKKRYRQVFDAFELRYVYAELSFHNKAFDQFDWQANMELICFKKDSKNTQICRLEFNKEISSQESVIFLREGWGNKKPGIYWKPGTYVWEAYINGLKVGSRYFYVQQTGKVDPILPDDYLSLKQVKLYEGPLDDLSEKDRVYLSTFSYNNTRFVYLELTFENNAPGTTWYLELITKFLNETRDLKGRVVKFLKIPKGQALIQLVVGWGADVPNTWREGMYMAELVFLDKHLGTVFIDMEEEASEGLPTVWLPDMDQPGYLSTSPPDAQGLEKVLTRLNNLIGLDGVKQSINDRTSYMNFLRLRIRKGFAEREPLLLHAVFKGNPGTGKTTVAKMMGDIYYQLGLLSKGHVHTVDRVDLVGEYIGQTAPKVRDALDKARGGVLFIDEAYSLARINDDAKDFGKEVLEILVKEMSDGPGDLMVVAAGYPSEMDHFLKSNPGIKSRIKMEIEFPDYTPDELLQIASIAAERYEVVLDESALHLLSIIIVREYRNRDKSFGNARFVFDIIEKAKIQMGLRIMSLPKPEEANQLELSAIQTEDILKAVTKPDKQRQILPIDDELLQEALNDLEMLHGLDEVKQEVNDIILLTKYHLASGRGKANLNSMHTLFIGNPGTGKTTVARILARIYKALGLLERGHIVETDRQGLVAGYVGQTAIKTNEKIQEALGGVLFIDEAYALAQSGTGQAGDFGDEAIQTLLKRMEDQRGMFFVFAAGYPDNMDRFLKANPGLKSRFDRTLIFKDYSPEQLIEIALLQLKDAGYILSAEALPVFQSWLKDLHSTRDRYFGNGRVVRQIVNSLIKEHQLFQAKHKPKNKKVQLENVIQLDTLIKVKDSKSMEELKKKGIGFGNN
jgi:SpoVK/Ycf46/Vps4 family AAA+-type ATPase